MHTPLKIHPCIILLFSFSIISIFHETVRRKRCQAPKKSHQTFRSIGGFGLAWQHPSLQLLYPMLCTMEEGFTPPPTSSPGLKTAGPNAAVATYIQLFRHSGHHRFFIIFQHVFMLTLVQFWTQLGSKIAQKSIPRRIFSNSETASCDFLDFAIPPMRFTRF